MAKRASRRPAPDDPGRPCPCGSGEGYPRCCGPLHRGQRSAATAEQLMRSRFSAFALGDTGYLLRTWHPGTRPAGLTLDPGQRWTRLEIVSTDRGGLFDAGGTVAFRAHYREAGQAYDMSERSRFTRHDGQWYYVDALPDGA